jgi:hypothetical protein
VRDVLLEFAAFKCGGMYTPPPLLFGTVELELALSLFCDSVCEVELEVAVVEDVLRKVWAPLTRFRDLQERDTDQHSAIRRAVWRISMIRGREDADFGFGTIPFICAAIISSGTFAICVSCCCRSKRAGERGRHGVVEVEDVKKPCSGAVSSRK